jgi:glycosyltransferase involved in cell wall biosynthesis
MRVGLVTGEYPPMEGGVGAFTRELARALAMRGDEVHIITQREARQEPPSGVRYSIQALRAPVESDEGLLHPFARRWGWRDVRLLVNVALRYELDVLNIQYQAAAFNMRSAAVNLAPWRLRGVLPVVVTFHDLRVPYLFPRAGRLREWVVRFMARQASGVIATNAADVERAEAWGAHEVRRIPIGSNITPRETDPEVAAAVRRRLGVRPADFLLGYFGFLNDSKGADSLVEALVQLETNVHLVFIGGRTGSSDSANNQRFLEQLDAKISRQGLGPRVHWTGFLSEEDVSTHLAASDLMVLPYRDGVSLRRGTLMAALAHGRPVLSTQPEAPVAELNHGGNIWLVPPGDSGALAAAIAVLRRSPETRRALAKAALELSRQFAWTEIAAATNAFYKALLS